MNFNSHNFSRRLCFKKPKGKKNRCKAEIALIEEVLFLAFLSALVDRFRPK